ncbi:MAG: bifunctional phosphoglucose/phosphomannose isomerase [Candidatus Sericytochromatia bacterium]|nr:bifunctional phosphoglucose/phosphomannose isomerase [Candidatus Tanganyikabacteria bacterium]
MPSFALDAESVRTRDPQDMLGRVYRLADVAGPAFARGAAWRPPALRPRQILVAGMGGSAISGDLARTLLAPAWDIPVAVWRQPGLPRWASPADLLVFLSYSGETSETLAAFGEAAARGIPGVAITVGGTLAARAGAAGIPILPLSPGWQPRAALGELYFTLLGVLHALGAPIDPEPALATLRARREEYGPATRDNLAMRIAATLQGTGAHNGGPRLPAAVFGVASSTEAVALRWKCQLNENAKATVLYNVFPELTHNEIVNLATAGPTRGPLIVLRDPADPPLLRRQVDAAIDLLGGAAYDLQGEGPDALARQLSLVLLGDYASVYLAVLAGVDPMPVEPIVALKGRMNAGGTE